MKKQDIKQLEVNPYDNLPSFIKTESLKSLKPVIEVKDLKHHFRTKKGKKILYDGLNLEIYENERLAIIGPNGAGKTYLVSLICGYAKFHEGEIKYNFKYSHSPYEKLSVQFQDLQFPSCLTPRDLIEFSQKLCDTHISSKMYNEGLKAFQIDKILDTKMSKLSGGQQQRVNVFIAMLSKPKVLFLDEFTTGLDIAIKNNIQDFINLYCDTYKVALVIISHDIDIIEEMVERVIVIANKHKIVDASAKDINTKFGSMKKFLRKYIIY